MWYFSPSLDASWNLSLEETLLEGKFSSSEGVLLFYRNQRAIVLGKHQNPYREVNWEILEKQDPPLFRRITGGGAVYHDEGNLNFAFFQPRESFNKQKNLELVRDALGTLGVDLTITERGDLFFHQWKVSGNALCYKKERVLHHGTLLLEADQACLQKAFYVSETHRRLFHTPAVASVPSATVNLKDFFPLLTVSSIVEAILAQAKARWGKVSFIENPFNYVSADQFQRARSRHSSFSWVFEIMPVFTLVLPSGEGELRVQEGIIVGVTGESSLKAYLGQRFTPGLLFQNQTSR